MPYANGTNQDIWSPTLHPVWFCATPNPNCEPCGEEKIGTGLRWGSAALGAFPFCDGISHVPVTSQPSTYRSVFEVVIPAVIPALWKAEAGGPL